MKGVLKGYGASANQAILNAFSFKLNSKAYENFMNDANQHTSDEKALEFIAERYKYRGGADHVLAEIKEVSQKPGESAGDFGERVGALLNKLRNLYDTDSSLGESQKITYRESSEAEALEQFLLGLRVDLQNQVRVKSARNLTGAIAEAIRVEQKTSSRRGEPIVNKELTKSSAISADALLKDLATKISALAADCTQTATVQLATAKMSCDYCKATSHREEECRKKIYDIKVCDYCNIRGHTHGEYYALSRAIREDRVNKQIIDNAVTQAPPVSQQPVVYAAYPTSGPAPAAYSAQTPRTSDVRRSPNTNAAGRPSRDYDNRRQTSGYQRGNRYNYPSRNYDRSDRDRRDYGPNYRRLRLRL